MACLHSHNNLGHGKIDIQSYPTFTLLLPLVFDPTLNVGLYYGVRAVLIVSIRRSEVVVLCLNWDI